ncbi:MAG: 2Fe-2S iron-sulfur cluster-binding protein [Lentimonas sp.]
MAKITYITQGENEIRVEDAVGTLMEIATENDVEGIDGDCGGVCSCSTCHVKVRREWLDKVGAASEIEQEMLDLEDETDARSRLCCQIEMSDELDGIVVDVVKL